MVSAPPPVADFAALIHFGQLARSTAYATAIYTGFLLAAILLESRAGADSSRYRTRSFFNDVLYTLFYKGGFYSVLLLAAVTNALEPRLGFLQLNLFRQLPWPVGLLTFWVAGDFVTYWWHRLQHANRFLWAFHSVHHSQEQLTLFSAARRHPLETLSMNVLLYFVIFHLVLGIPTRGWMPLEACITVVVAFQHAQLEWRYGPLARVLVSPRFHAFHHSTEPAHANANFGFLFSSWDYLFGTAVPEQPRPARYGVEGLEMRETIGSQLVTPFRLLWRWRRAAPAVGAGAGVPQPGMPAAPG
jgi:sterol desaturase/sphingolipid hydroxylase (fatty acid hydroxylase superfamily)